MTAATLSLIPLRHAQLLELIRKLDGRKMALKTDWDMCGVSCRYVKRLLKMLSYDTPFAVLSFVCAWKNRSYHQRQNIHQWTYVTASNLSRIILCIRTYNCLVVDLNFYSKNKEKNIWKHY